MKEDIASNFLSKEIPKICKEISIMLKNHNIKYLEAANEAIEQKFCHAMLNKQFNQIKEFNTHLVRIIDSATLNGFETEDGEYKRYLDELSSHWRSILRLGQISLTTYPEIKILEELKTIEAWGELESLPGAWKILLLLFDNGPLKEYHITHRCGGKHESCCKQIDRLERNGFISQRGSLWKITSKSYLAINQRKSKEKTK